MKNILDDLKIDIKAFSNRYLIRNVDFGDNFEIFFVSAILAILGIRIYLQYTNFPILGTGNIHIGHMLWGGSLMLLALLIVYTFLGRFARYAAAILGGLGFGTFIDELGKFITSDNNYFYKPTFSIIYVIFILLYLLFKLIQGKQRYSQKEYLANGIEYIEDAISNDLDEEEKNTAIKLLSNADQKNPITKALIKLFKDLETIPNEKPDILSRLKSRFSEYYFSLVRSRWFPNIINGIFLLQLFISILFIFLSIFSTANILNIIASTISGIFIIWGVLLMRRSRLEAFHKFKDSILISIFLVQVFTFYQEQLRAFLGLIANILILMALNYMIVQERNVLKKN